MTRTFLFAVAPFMVQTAFAIQRQPEVPTRLAVGWRSAESQSLLESLVERDGFLSRQRSDPHEFVRLHINKPTELAKNQVKYLFASSTGHAGSTSLSTRASYSERGRENILFRFEDYLSNANTWSQWFDRKPSHHSVLRKVSQYKNKIDTLLKQSNKTTYVDMGHHILHGIHDVLPNVFGKHDLVMLRVRRARDDVALSSCTKDSKYHYKFDLCKKRSVLCPLRHNVLLRPLGNEWDEGAWENLTCGQKSFWYIDEVEARWQALVHKHPDMMYLECEWHTDLKPCFKAVAAILDVQIEEGGMNKEHHVRSRTDMDEIKRRLRKEDAEYQGQMQYSTSVKTMIRAAQF